MSDPLVTTPDPRRGLPIRTLCVQVPDGPDAGVVHRACEDKLAVGTANGNDVVLTDDSVSRYHLELSRGRSGVRVVDCGSTNGTLIHGLQVEAVETPAGTVIQLSRTRLKITDGDEVTLDVHDRDALAGLRGLAPYREPQLGKRGLCRAIGGTSIPDLNLAMLWVLQLSDGGCDLVAIVERAKLPFATIRAAADHLRDAGLLARGDCRKRRVRRTASVI